MCARRIFRLKNKLISFLFIIIFASLTLFFTRKSKEKISIFKYLSRYEWTLNTDVLQYSSIIIFNSNDVIVEGLIFLNNKNEFQRTKTSTKCIVLRNENELIASVAFKIIKIPLMNKSGDKDSIGLWKVKCKFDKFDKRNDDDYKVAIVNSNHFKNDKYKNIFSNPSADLPDNLIKYQNPTFYYSNQRKKPAIANCVHLVRDLNSNRLTRVLNWLEIQFSISIKQIKFYIFEPNAEAKRLIYSKYSSEQVIFVDYETNKNQICKQEIEMMKLNPNNYYSKYLFGICEQSFNKHFNMSKDYTLNAHERINTNDCYMHYRNEYEYVTNFDFDELFFPREYETRFGMNGTDYCLSKKRYKKKYNIYDYAKRLFNSFEFKVASLSFDHVLFINVTDEFIDSVFEIKNKKHTLSLKNNEGGSINFDIFSQDKDYLNYLLNSKNIFNCLKSELMGNWSLWNNVYATRMRNRDGKSIFNSEYTEAINQHFSSVLMPGTKKAYIPITDGYSSHYREITKNFYFNQHIPIKDFFIDLEYYLFLINL
jgi:hypothetical protein